MRLARHGGPGRERPIVSDDDATWHDLTPVTSDITGDFLRDGLAGSTWRRCLSWATSADSAAASGHRQDRLHRAELPRPRRRDGRGHSRRADPVPQDAGHGGRPRRRGADPAQIDQDRLGGRARRCDRGAEARYLDSPGRRRGVHRRATRSAMTCPSASSSSNAAASGTRARTARRSTRSARGCCTADEVADPQALGMRLWVNGGCARTATPRT